jgi:hypothetical protein
MPCSDSPCNRELYLWACVMISSRAFPSHLIDPTIRVEDSVPVLLPGMDAFNHNPHKKVLWNKLDNGVALITEEPIRAGEQAFNSYGPKSNEGEAVSLMIASLGLEEHHRATFWLWFCSRKQPGRFRGRQARAASKTFKRRTESGRYQPDAQATRPFHQSTRHLQGWWSA